MCDQDTVRIPLRARDGSVRAYAIVDAADAEWVNQWRWHLSKGYAARNSEPIDGQRHLIYLHRELLGLPRASDGREGDHIDHVTLNDRRENLRVLPKGGNGQNVNTPHGSISRYRGVTWSKLHRQWRARIQINGKNRHLGYFDGEHQAADAAKAARLRLMPFAVD